MFVKLFKWAVTLCVIFIGIIFIFAFLGQKGSQTQPSTAASISEATVPAPAPARVPARIGDTVQTGYWSYKVEKYHWTPYLVSYGSAVRPDAQFLVLELSAQNNDRTASTLPPVKLINDKGQEFSESSEGSMSDGFFSPLKELNPGVGSKGLIAFDVPPGNYKVKLSGGFESGDTVLVSLDSPAPAATPRAHEFSREDLIQRMRTSTYDGDVLPMAIWQETYVLANRGGNASDDELLQEATLVGRGMGGDDGPQLARLFAQTRDNHDDSRTGRAASYIQEIAKEQNEQMPEAPAARGSSPEVVRNRVEPSTGTN